MKKRTDVKIKLSNDDTRIKIRLVHNKEEEDDEEEDDEEGEQEEEEEDEEEKGEGHPSRPTGYETGDIRSVNPKEGPQIDHLITFQRALRPTIFVFWPGQWQCYVSSV